MICLRTIDEVRTAVRTTHAHGLCVGLVPTMGFLHDGHRSLIEQAARENDRVMVSIFVNPTQFGPDEDYASYPRDLQRDMAVCQAAGAAWVFVPEAPEIYPEESLVSFDVRMLGDHLCGARRPGHFRGVCQVVSKLFNICQPDRAYFGEKDAQQLAIIRQLTADLNFPAEIVGCPIVREADGLALSSRNTYLSPEQRQAALIVPKCLDRAHAALAAGERSAGRLEGLMAETVAGEPLARPDYLSVVDSRKLQPVQSVEGPVLVAVAIFIGQTRLIDNFTFELQRGSNTWY